MTTPPVLSVSQVEDFDPEQLGGCPRRWWFERVQGHRVESTTAHEDGHQGHALLARYLATGERPGRVRLGKAVNAVIDSGVLPAPGEHLRVEERFSLQDHRDTHGQWVPLDVRRTLWHAGHPWEGFIDLRWRSGSTVTVWDHKFSSDIHARALPAERLIRTVQMPIYALDSLRRWPDATALNLVHLYVSRRGVESFVRQQVVTVEQVHERADEISGLVREMDAARGAAVQDEVPFNRAACHARMGCPHQFRCNAFKRRNTTMDLTPEEKAMFGMLSDEGPQPARVMEPLERPAAGRVEAPADLNLDDIFEPPTASTPKPQPAPTCEACGAVLTPENSSRLRDGTVKHIGCAADARAPEAAKLSPRAEQELSGPRCENCPHPAHAGRPCEGKRGRGACRCGATVEQPQRPQPPAVPKFEVPQEVIDGQKRWEEGAPAADADGDGAAIEEARVLREAAEQAKREEPTPGAMEPRNSAGFNRPTETEEEYAVELGRKREEALASARQRISELEEALKTARARLEEMPTESEVSPPTGSWPGTLAVTVTVELGPATLAILAGLFKR